jgi:hypothetical protein
LKCIKLWKRQLPVILNSRLFSRFLRFTALAGGCAAASGLPLASVMGSPNASAPEIHNNTE